MKAFIEIVTNHIFHLGSDDVLKEVNKKMNIMKVHFTTLLNDIF